VSFFTNSDWYQTFVVREDGEPIDLTGRELQLSLRRTASGTDTLIDLSVSAGTIVIVDGPAGKFAVDVPHAQSQNVPPGNHYWDLVHDIGNGRQSRMAGGRWLVRQGVTP